MKAITLSALFAGNKIARAAAFAAVAGMCWMPALGGMDDVVLKCETEMRNEHCAVLVQGWREDEILVFAACPGCRRADRRA